MALKSQQYDNRLEFTSLFVLFIIVFAYINIRAVHIGLVHDESVSLWAYMIHWNPFPYQGFINTNNHFINSLLGGFFIRLFNTNAAWVIRLPNILSFIIYYWAIVGLKPFFQNKFNFYYLFIALVFTPMLLEYMGMARGYGLSMAFMVLAFQQTQAYLRHKRAVNFIFVQLCWILAVYSNLTLIVFAMAGMFYVTLINQKRWQVIYIIGYIISMLPVLYLLKYIFYLKNIGILDVAGKKGFFINTVHSLTHYVWNTRGLVPDMILVLVFISICIVLVLNLLKEKSIFRNHILIPSFLVMAVTNIVIQNLLFNIGFPVDRMAIYLVLFFFFALFYSIDSVSKSIWYGLPIAVISIILFIPQVNFKYIKLYYNEHLDDELFTKIPAEVKGIPVSTGGRFWSTDNEYLRKNKLKLMAFQETKLSTDTLTDYIINTNEIFPELQEIYHVIHTDPISKVTLYKRNKFLNRHKADDNQINIIDSQEYYDIYRKPTRDNPVYFRCSGILKDMTLYKDVIAVFSAEDSVSGKSLRYDALHITESCAINDEGEIAFDFTLAMNCYSEANMIKVYIWNPYKSKLNGNLSLEIYDIKE
jgi:hypothetical protein